MASVYQWKPRFQGMLRPLVARLADRGVTANAVTVAAMLLSVGWGAAIALAGEQLWPLWGFPVVMLVRMAMNAIDGMLAREFGQQSRTGAMLNEVGDVVSDAALYLPLALVEGVVGWQVVAFVLVALLTEFVGVVSVQIGGGRRYDGPMGKSDRAVCVSLMALLLAGDWFAPLAIQVGWIGLILLSIATVAQRWRRALKVSDPSRS